MASSDRTAGFGPLEGSKTALLTTFRPGGEAVGTPLSIAVGSAPPSPRGMAWVVAAASSSGVASTGRPLRNRSRSSWNSAAVW